MSHSPNATTPISGIPDALQRRLAARFPSYALIDRLDEGWSADEKFRLRGRQDKMFLLRTSNSVSEVRRLAQADAMGNALKAGINAPLPIETGLFEDGSSYILQTWLEGTSLEKTLPQFDLKKQYELGLSAGSLLKSLHGISSIPISRATYPDRLKKTFRKLAAYKSSGIRVAGEDLALQLLKERLPLLDGRPLCLQHGDFHPGNMLVMAHGGLGIIDFDRCDYSDPYEEFYKAELFARPLSAAFTNGQLHAYFDGDPPSDFWYVLSVYLAGVMLYSPVWAIPFGQTQIDYMCSLSELVLKDFDGFKSSLPLWYVPFNDADSLVAPHPNG